MMKIFCIIFTVLIAVSCVSSNFSDNVTIRQTESDYSVVISKNKEDKVLVLFYLTYDIRKKDVAPYFEKMKSEHKDTLHIGTIQQLKQTNPELMNELLQGDSILFNFVYKDNFHHIKLPVEIR
ncbi:hypothetical protein ACMSE0_23630 [Bacteroides thetaiotaomicron]|jgi:hypothetical protein